MGMTNEEAKKIIFNQWQSFLEHNIDYGGISEAYKMAIKALEQQGHVWEIAYERGKVEALNMAIKTLEQTRWISCSERLPEENIHVLCQFYMGGMAECYHAHGMWHIVGGLRISCDEVIAWMPLPEPYKEDSNGGEKCERCIYTYGTLGCISNVGGISVYDCDFGQEQFEKRRFLNEYLRKWLSSFNTDSATCCFTAVNQLKQELEGKP